MKIKINKGQFGLKTKYLNEAIQFAEDYRNSPGFNERWNRIGKIPGTYRTKNSVYNPLSQYEHKLLWKKGEFKKGKYIPWKEDPKNSMYKYGNGDFYIGISKTPGKAFSNWKDVLTHEAGHYLEESLNNPTLIYKDGSYYPSPLNFYSEIYPIFRKSNSYKNITDIISEDEETARNYNKKPVTESWNFNYDWGTDDLHDASPSESYADLFLLRKKLLDSGIYDSRKANNLFKQEHLDKFKKQNKNKIRLFDNFSDKDIIWMMNNIAQNNKIQNNQQNYYAKNGGSIKADNARKWKRKAQMGMLIEFAQNLKNLPTDLTNSALNFYSDYKKSDSNRDKELAQVGLEKAIAQEEELKKIKAQTQNYLQQLNASSPLGINYSPIDARTKSYSENTGIEKANNIYNTKVQNINNKYKQEQIDSLNKFASSTQNILSKVLNPSKGSSENLDASSIFGNLDTSSIFGNLTSMLPV